ncbi:MAG: glycosyltransferase family 2 protein [Microcoleaceae cyanobacterium]
MIYFVVVNYYSSHLIQKLIASLPQNQEVSYQVIIVNNSPDDELILNPPFPQQGEDHNSIVILDAQENLGFGKACNLALKWIYQQNSQALVWLINPDAYLSETNALNIAQEFFITYPEVSILGTTVYEESGKVWFGGGNFIKEKGVITAHQFLSSESENLPYIEQPWVTGCSLLIALKNFTEIPQFNPDYFLYYEDFDFCQRYQKQGHIIALTKQIRVQHQPSSITSRNQDLKIQHSIYSYLLSLEKHCHKRVLWYRFVRILLTSLITLPLQGKISLSKLKGIWLFWKIRRNRVS